MAIFKLSRADYTRNYLKFINLPNRAKPDIGNVSAKNSVCSLFYCLINPCAVRREEFTNNKFQHFFDQLFL